MAEQTEQNRSEEPTPFKLKRARERGMVPRSIELGFLAGLVAVTLFAAIAGNRLAVHLAEATRATLISGIDGARDTGHLPAIIANIYWAALLPLSLFAGTISAIVVLLEILQLRGLVLSTHPLKPDFSRLNPAKGLKRLFSPRLIKETLKTVAKSAIYALVTWQIVAGAVHRYGEVANQADRLPDALRLAAAQLVFAYMAIALGFVLLDQMLVRRDYLKQMRMSRREIKREAKEREGEPRIKQKRRQLHADFLKTSKSIGALAGSDMLVVNPEHFAVGLRYDQNAMAAPQVTAKGRNRFALMLKDEAFRQGIAIVPAPAVARALYRDGEIGQEIPASRFSDVAPLYSDLYRSRDKGR